jgi:hypothetical protein
MIWGIAVGAAIVMAAAGVAKLAKPDVTTDAVHAAGLPASRGAVTLLGVAELHVGEAVIVWQTRPAAVLLALLYLGFVGYSLRLLIVRGPAASCGCFGQRHATVGAEHVVVNVAVALVALGAAAGIGPDSVDPVAAIGSTALLFVLLAVVPSLRVARH